jgi:hypothetical protein
VRQCAGVAGLVGAVREHAGVEHRRAQRVRDQQRRRDDESVDHHQPPLVRRLQQRAGQRRDLEAAEGGQRLQRSARVRVARRDARQQHALARQPGVVEPGAAADAVVERRAGEARRQQRGGRAVADAHLAQHQRVAGQRAHAVAPELERLHALRRTHRRALRGVGGAGADRSHEARHGGRGGIRRAGRHRATHAGVDHRQPQPVLPRQHADRGAAGDEVGHHLRRHLGRVGRHAARRQPVVGGEHQRLRRLKARIDAALQQPELQHQRLDAAERAERLRETVDALPQPRLERRVGAGPDRRRGPGPAGRPVDGRRTAFQAVGIRPGRPFRDGRAVGARSRPRAGRCADRPRPRRRASRCRVRRRCIVQGSGQAHRQSLGVARRSFWNEIPSRGAAVATRAPAGPGPGALTAAPPARAAPRRARCTSRGRRRRCAGRRG